MVYKYKSRQELNYRKSHTSFETYMLYIFVGFVLVFGASFTLYNKHIQAEQRKQEEAVQHKNSNDIQQPRELTVPKTYADYEQDHIDKLEE